MSPLAQERNVPSVHPTSHNVPHRRSRDSPHNTGDKLRSSIACAGFVCFIPLFGGLVALPSVVSQLRQRSSPTRYRRMVAPYPPERTEQRRLRGR